MDYPTYQQQGWPIGSGSVESSHKLVVQARLKGPGMHWRPEHINPMLALRLALLNERWEEAWQEQHRLRQRQHQLKRRTHQQQRFREQQAKRQETHPPPCPLRRHRSRHDRRLGALRPVSLGKANLFPSLAQASRRRKKMKHTLNCIFPCYPAKNPVSNQEHKETANQILKMPGPRKLRHWSGLQRSVVSVGFTVFWTVVACWSTV